MSSRGQQAEGTRCRSRTSMLLLNGHTAPPSNNTRQQRYEKMTFKIVSLAIEAIRGLSSSENSPEFHAKIERAIVALNDLRGSL